MLNEKISIRPLGGKPKLKLDLKLDLSNYATKAYLRNVAGVHTLKFAKKVDLASSKSEIDKLDVVKLGTTPVDLKKLSYVVW